MTEAAVSGLAHTPPGFRSGYISLIGKPNAGKSTLLNRLVARKLAAMSRRPQTTRNKITGVCHLEGGQLILLDTPGIHEGKTTLNRLMVETSVKTLSDADALLVLITADTGWTAEDALVMEHLRGVDTPKILAINKIDRVPKPALLGLIDSLPEKEAFREIVPCSALTGDGLGLLKRVLLKQVPEGPAYFPEGMVTDCPEEFLAAEIIREKIIKLTHMELPYAVAVVVESMQPGQRPGVTVIQATVVVDKPSQKKIVIGEGGARLKTIGAQARQELERRLGNRIYLHLHVKVKSGWRDDLRSLRRFGYTHDSY